MTTRKAIIVGPFSRGINTFDDPTAIHDQECAEALNFDPGLDGSLKSRPPFTDVGAGIPFVGRTPRLLGFFYDTAGVPILIASDGLSSTYRFSSGTWTLITSTFAAADMTQFDGKAWLVAPVGEADPGGYWTPAGGFVADSAMPKGSSITSYKSRLWVAQGIGGSNPTRVYYSKVLGQPSFWTSPAFIDVGSGDGQNVVKIVTYYDTMLVFRTKSIWSFQYGSDPAAAIQGVIVPGVGLQSRHALVTYENYLYFMYDEKAYEFVNNRVSQINIKVPFRTNNPGSTDTPFTVSLFNNRVLYSFYENIYVYSLRTKTWTTWRSDAWGPIGQIMMPYTDSDADVGYALPSGNGFSSAEVSRNLIWNPEAAQGKGYWGNSTGSKDIAFNSSNPSGFAAVEFLTTGDNVRSQVRTYNTRVTPGQVIYLVSFLRSAQAGSFEGYIYADFIDETGTEGAGNGTIVGSTISDITYTPITNTGWTTVSQTITVPQGAVFMRTPTGIRMPVATANLKFWIDKAGALTNGETETFSGYNAETENFRFSWSGEVSGSPSIKANNSLVPLLRIEDGFGSGREDMLCILRTKNYNFDVPGSFKVLFWWGIDAIFKTEIQGQVIPGVYNLSTTWGKLFTEAISWGTILGGTWAHPYLSDSSVTTDVNAGPGPFRKFVKFMKKLRFRQLQFRVTFKTDGSDATAPVQIFTLSTYMTEKQTVSKTIS